jgi:phytoene dehydrogenase-like protein
LERPSRRRPSASRSSYDAIVVGAGPNGLSAAIRLARAGLATLLVEADETIGGGARTQELTLPGFAHDVCSSVHPLGLASPYLRSLDLERHGVSWIQPPSAVVHVLDEENAVTLERAVEDTAAQFGRDGRAYRQLVERFVEPFDSLLEMILGPLRFPARPALLASFGLTALRSLERLGETMFRDEGPRALLAGIGAHAMLPLDQPATASFALVLAVAGHAVGWPIARGGSQVLSNALAACFRQAGGELLTGWRVERLEELPRARSYVLDVGPRQLLKLGGDRLPSSYRDRLTRFRFGPGVYKMDWALSAPIPWTNPSCARSATVHLAGTLAKVARAEAAVHRGELDAEPFVILVQPSLFDDSRAPPGKHVAWAYCHVPHGSSIDASELIEATIERVAPGFQRTILARATRNALQIEQHNPNYVGGDINGGLSDLGQLFFRPMARFDPYSTPAPDLFLCSSSTPPGGGVHGMCGYWAASSVMRRVFRLDSAR